jgi:hypothetical protein
MLHPVGGLPSRTYWRRRAALGAAVLMSAVLIKTELLGDSSDAATRPGTQQGAPERTTAAPAPVRSPAPVGTPAPTARRDPPAATEPAVSSPAATSPAVSKPAFTKPALPPVCPESALRLQVTPGAASYRIGELPVVRYSVTNHSRRTCRRDLGPALQEALVYDRTQRLWSSNDCWPGVEHRVVRLRPGRPETFSMRWSRTSSRPGCAGIRRVVPAGTYTLVGRVGGLIARSPINLS